jgi:hypothetical protein
MAAYLDDDFQSYAIGATLPLGSWIASGAFFTPSIQSQPEGTGIPGTDRSLGVFLATAEYVHGSYLASFTEYVALYLGSSTNAQGSIAFSNGATFGAAAGILTIQIEPDSSISLVCPSTNEILANSCDALFRFYTWNFFQINVVLTDVLVAGVAKVHIFCEVALNGNQVVACDVTTNVNAGGLTGATSAVNRFQLPGGTYGAFTLDTLAALPDYPHAGTPNAVVKQAVIEVDEVLDSGKIDVFQAVTEVDVLPDSAKVKIFQMVIEVDLLQSGRWNIYES